MSDISYGLKQELDKLNKISPFETNCYAEKRANEIFMKSKTYKMMQKETRPEYLNAIKLIEGDYHNGLMTEDEIGNVIKEVHDNE